MRSPLAVRSFPNAQGAKCLTKTWKASFLVLFYSFFRSDTASGLRRYLLGLFARW